MNLVRPLAANARYQHSSVHAAAGFQIHAAVCVDSQTTRHYQLAAPVSTHASCEQRLVVRVALLYHRDAKRLGLRAFTSAQTVFALHLPLSLSPASLSPHHLLAHALRKHGGLHGLLATRAVRWQRLNANCAAKLAEHAQEVPRLAAKGPRGIQAAFAVGDAHWKDWCAVHERAGAELQQGAAVTSGALGRDSDDRPPGLLQPAKNGAWSNLDW